MKPIYALLFIVTFLAGQALGQTLAPAEAAGSGLWPLVIVALIGGGGYLIFLWHKRNPSQADAALAAAKADAAAVAHKALDIADGLRQTVAKQATVLASPPVQAAINGPAPPPPAQNAPGRTITPLPVQAPPAPVAAAPAAAVAVPAGGEAPPVVVVATAPYPPPGMPPSEVIYNAQGVPDPTGQFHDYQVAAVLAQQREFAVAVATGPLDLGALESSDKAYIRAMAENMNFDPRNLVRGPFYGVVSAEMGRDTYPEMGPARFNTLEFEKTVTPGVVQVVRELAQGTAAWIPAAFAGWGGAGYIAARQSGWAAGWQRVHGAPA